MAWNTKGLGPARAFTRCRLHLLVRAYRDLDKRRRRRAVVDDVPGDADIRLAVVGEHGIAAVGIARTTRKIAAADIDLDPTA